MTQPVNYPPLTEAQKAWTGFVISLVVAVGAVVTTALSDGVWSTMDTIAAVVALAGAVGTGLGVYLVPNKLKV